VLIGLFTIEQLVNGITKGSTIPSRRRKTASRFRPLTPSSRGWACEAPVILALMSFCFLFFGYLGCPCRFR